MATIYFVSRTWAPDDEPTSERVYFKSEEDAVEALEEMRQEVGSWVEVLEVIELDTVSLEETRLTGWEGNEDDRLDEDDEEEDED